MTWTSAAHGQSVVSYVHVVSRRASSVSWRSQGPLTPSGWVLAHVLLLVASEKTLCLGLRSWATGQLLVEVHHLVHAHGIGRGSDSLSRVSALALCAIRVVRVCGRSVAVAAAESFAVDREMRGYDCEGPGSSAGSFGELLRWEKQSREDYQYHAPGGRGV